MDLIKSGQEIQIERVDKHDKQNIFYNLERFEPITIHFITVRRNQRRHIYRGKHNMYRGKATA